MRIADEPIGICDAYGQYDSFIWLRSELCTVRHIYLQQLVQLSDCKYVRYTDKHSRRVSCIRFIDNSCLLCIYVFEHDDDAISRGFVIVAVCAYHKHKFKILFQLYGKFDDFLRFVCASCTVFHGNQWSTVARWQSWLDRGAHATTVSATASTAETASAPAAQPAVPPTPAAPSTSAADRSRMVEQ